MQALPMQGEAHDRYLLHWARGRVSSSCWISGQDRDGPMASEFEGGRRGVYVFDRFKPPSCNSLERNMHVTGLATLL